MDQRAGIFLGLIAKLFQVEEEAKDLAPEARLALRQERSAEVLSRFDEERLQLRDQVLPKSLLADALGYVENQRQALGRFAGRVDGHGTGLNGEQPGFGDATFHMVNPLAEPGSPLT